VNEISEPSTKIKKQWKELQVKSNVEIFRIISQPFMSNMDIQKVIGCSPAQASRIRSNIEKDVLKENKIMPRKGYSKTSRVLDKLGLSLDDIHRLAKLEIELENKRGSDRAK